MTFAEWVKLKGFDWRQAGDAIGCTAAEAWQYAKGERLPRRVKVLEIFKATDHAVTPLDWYGLTFSDLAEPTEPAA